MKMTAKEQRSKETKRGYFSIRNTSRQAQDAAQYASRFTQHAARFLSPALQQTALLFIIDMLTNATDYGFHIYLGRTLAEGAFAQVQTVNSLVLIMVTTFSVLQPVIARYAAANEGAAANGYFQRFARLSGIVGLLLALGFAAASKPLGDWLNVPPLAVAFLGGLAVMACVRPVLAGMLQGRQQFIGFGLVRTGFAFGRFLSAILLLTLFAKSASNAVAAYPLGGIISLAVALLFLGNTVWQRGEPVKRSVIHDGLRLSAAAFIAYAAFMSLQNVDLIWVNRLFSAEASGSYASAVVLRRVLAVLPGAVTVILYPRIVNAIEKGQLPDRLLLQAAALITLPTLLLAVAYQLAGDWIVNLVFGAGYDEAGVLLGWFGLAMIGFGLATVWLNLFLATRPWLFVYLLLALAIGQLLLLNGFRPSTLSEVAKIFTIGGWGCAIGGGVLYFGWLRGKLSTISGQQSARHNN